MRFTPHSYQEVIVKYVIEHKRCAIWASMGLGKTVAVLTALDKLMLIGALEGPILVLAPLRVAKSVWPSEVSKWYHLSHLTVSVITGGVRERVASVRLKADIHTINYENLVWLTEYCDEHMGGWPFKVVVADESTKLKGFRSKQGTKRAKALGKKTHTDIERFIELTGTPAPNGLKDLWGQIWFLDAGKRLGRSFTAFSKRWFRAGWNGFGLAPIGCAQKDIQAKVKDICLVLEASDYFDLEDPILNTIKVDLPPAARVIYDKMEQDMFAELVDEYEKTHEIEAFNAAAKSMKCLQIANGAVYTGYRMNDVGVKKPTCWKTVHDAKIEALKDIVEEAAGAPILVAYQFKSDLSRLTKAFPTARVLDAEKRTEDYWNAGRIPVLIAHPQSAGHGLNLQHGGNILVFFGHTWSLEDYLQMVERIGPVRQKQSGYDRPVFIHFIVARDTVDELVMERRVSKKSVQDILMAAIKRRNK